MAAVPMLCGLCVDEDLHDKAFKKEQSRLHIVRKPGLRVRQAVRDNNVPLLRRLKERVEPVDLRNTDKLRLTSLAWAALELSLEAFEWLLLDYGHDFKELSRDAEHNTIFHLLAAAPAPPGLSPFTHLLLSDPLFPPRPQTRSHDELIDISLSMAHTYFEEYPFIIDWSNRSGKTPLHLAAMADNAPFIAMLCERGAEVDLTDLQGNTPLHYAGAWGHISCIRVLLEYGAASSARNFEAFTPAEYAYSHSIKNAIEQIAAEIAEERRVRRREERAREKEAQRREYELLQREQEQWEARQEAGRTESSVRLRSGSESTSASHGSALSSGFRLPEAVYPQPPMPPLPPDVAAAAAAATLARNERQVYRSSYANGDSLSRTGSPTPVASRHVSNSNVPTLSLVTPTPTHVTNATLPFTLNTLPPSSSSPSPTPSPTPGSSAATARQRPLPSRSPSMPSPGMGPPPQFQPPFMRRGESETHAL